MDMRACTQRRIEKEKKRLKYTIRTPNSLEIRQGTVIIVA